MLGGQYWGFYYISDNEPGFDFELELTKAEFGWEWNEPNGNNYYYTERITDNWFYWLIDYDH